MSAAAIAVASLAVLTACTGSGSSAKGGSASAASPLVSAPARAAVHPVPQRTVQPPTPGSVNKTEAGKAAPRTLSPVKLDGGTAQYGSGISATITAVEAINAVSPLPGEVGGPSVQVTVRVNNASARSVSLSDVVANATDSTGEPTTQVTVKPARPLSGSVPAHSSMTGVYVFTVSTKHRNPITVSITYSPNAPTAQFTGDVK